MHERVSTWVRLLALLVVIHGLTGLHGASMAAPPAGPTAESTPARVDINTADEQALQKIPGIGEALAKRIVEFRKQHGPFERVEDLMKVRGIGEKSLEKMRPYVKVGKGK